MELIADSGSTKTDWCLVEDNSKVLKISTQGINPYHMDTIKIKDILLSQLIPHLRETIAKTEINVIRYYGAGCTPAMCPIMEEILRDVFPNVKVVEVGSDLLGAAKALCGDSEGIACILGTGSNSCLYDGKEIVGNVSPMGYILGDEGSGAVIGKTFIGELYKGQHQDFIPVFEKETGLTLEEIIRWVYREPVPNRFLASLSTFIHKHIEENSWIETMIIDCFRLFFQRNVSHYGRPDLPVNFVGSIAFYYREQLEKAARLENFAIGKVMKAPLQSLSSRLDETPR